MDLYNNAVGHRLGERATAARECGELVRQAFSEEALIWLDDVGGCGSYRQSFP